MRIPVCISCELIIYRQEIIHNLTNHVPVLNKLESEKNMLSFSSFSDLKLQLYDLVSSFRQREKHLEKASSSRTLGVRLFSRTLNTR